MALAPAAAAAAGREEKFAGFDAYVASPDAAADALGGDEEARARRKRCAVVVLPDAVGYKEAGVRDLVDELARCGYETGTRAGRPRRERASGRTCG